MSLTRHDPDDLLYAHEKRRAADSQNDVVGQDVDYVSSEVSLRRLDGNITLHNA
jgi:hypothetical protein